MSKSATMIWRQLLSDLLVDGKSVSQETIAINLRGRTRYELLAHCTVWPMSNPLVLCPDRRLDYRFLAAKAAWVLSGSNRINEIAPFAKHLAARSDDGIHLYGAIGPMFCEQLPYVLDTLVQDRTSQLAVMSLWHTRPGTWKDVSDVLTLLYMIQPKLRNTITITMESGVEVDTAGTLHCVAFMRANDAWYGTPYDVHTFSMTAAYVALMLRDRIGPLKLGSLFLTSGSQYLHHMDRDMAEKCANVVTTPPGSEDSQKTDLTLTRLRSDEVLEVASIDLAEFEKPDDLIQHLWTIAYSGAHASGKPSPYGMGYFVGNGWLSETVR